ncbi:MAG TPA: hypothetical protein PKL31_02165 [Fulvivirga sp.]|nr:hypothetical protein [Fulvivirga sp.]
MSLISENVIPGNFGKVFGTDAKEDRDLEKIQRVVSGLEGIKDVILNKEVYPREFTVHTSKLISIITIEEKVKAMGFHAIPKEIFPL